MPLLVRLLGDHTTLRCPAKAVQDAAPRLEVYGSTGPIDESAIAYRPRKDDLVGNAVIPRAPMHAVETFDREGDKNFLRRRRDLRAKDFSGLATGAADSLDVCRERIRIGRELGVADVPEGGIAYVLLGVRCDAIAHLARRILPR